MEHMIEWLRQKRKEMNKTVKYVMKITSQVNDRDQGRGQL